MSKSSKNEAEVKMKLEKVVNGKNIIASQERKAPFCDCVVLCIISNACTLLTYAVCAVTACIGRPC